MTLLLDDRTVQSVFDWNLAIAALREAYAAADDEARYPARVIARGGGNWLRTLSGGFRRRVRLPQEALSDPRRCAAGAAGDSTTRNENGAKAPKRAYPPPPARGSGTSPGRHRPEPDAAEGLSLASSCSGS